MGWQMKSGNVDESQVSDEMNEHTWIEEEWSRMTELNKEAKTDGECDNWIGREE